MSVKPYNVKIDLKFDDIDILEKIKIAMNYDYDIRHYTQECKYKDRKNAYISKTVRLNITNKSIVEKMIEYNIVSNKSNILDFKWDVIPRHLIRHFIRGLWDGDGCVYASDNLRSSYINLTSSTVMLNKVKEILLDNFSDVKIYTYNRRKENMQNGTIIISNTQNIIDVLNYLYNDSKIYLDRKYQKYQQIIHLFKTQTTIS